MQDTAQFRGKVSMDALCQQCIMEEASSIKHPWLCILMIFRSSWTTIVVHNRNDQEVGVAHEVKSPKKPASIFQMMMGQYWLGKTIIHLMPSNALFSVLLLVPFIFADSEKR